MIKAIYTQGIFKPLEPVKLPEGYEVEIEIAKAKSRPVVRFEDIKPEDWPFPPEPEWAEMWEDRK